MNNETMIDTGANHGKGGIQSPTSGIRDLPLPAFLIDMTASESRMPYIFAGSVLNCGKLGLSLLV
jgi:hypothetical protein